METKIDVYNDTLYMKFNREVINVNTHDVIRYLINISYMNILDAIELLRKECYELFNPDMKISYLGKNLNSGASKEMMENVQIWGGVDHYQ